MVGRNRSLLPLRAQVDQRRPDEPRADARGVRRVGPDALVLVDHLLEGRQSHTAAGFRPVRACPPVLVQLALELQAELDLLVLVPGLVAVFLPGRPALRERLAEVGPSVLAERALFVGKGELHHVATVPGPILMIPPCTLRRAPDQ